MTRRMIDSSMWSNENFAALPAMARLLQIGMINHADDQGRIKANPLYLAKEIFPYDRVTPTNVTKWLELIAGNGTITLYTLEGKQYAQLTKWWAYQSLQYAAPSEYPAPPSWKDRIRRTATKGVIATYNWTLTNGVTVDDTCDEHGKLLPPTLNAKLSSTSTPPTNGNGHSPVESPPHSPESSPERTNKLNLIELNLTEEEAATHASACVPTPAATAAIDQSIAKVWEAWSANMPGTLTPVIVDAVNGLLDDYSPAEIEEAIAIACKRNNRSLGYIEGILAKGVFRERSIASGGDYRPTKTSNRGLAAATGYMQRKGMLNGRN